MKKLSTALLLIATLNSSAQKGLDEMIAAEKSFAAYAVANNTVDAFLRFMDTSAVMFRDGEPYKAYADWQKRKKQPGVLNWWPLYAEVSIGGNFGYTCGPWTFQLASIKDSIIGRGFFFTIWQKKAGNWKFVFDIGVDADAQSAEASLTKLQKEKKQGIKLSLLDTEERFLRLHEHDPPMAYQMFASSDVIFASENTGLDKDSNAWKVVTAKSPIAFTYKGSGIAPSGDLGYTYGSATLNGKKEGYLRIWRCEPGGWKIALQMIRL